MAERPAGSRYEVIDFQSEEEQEEFMRTMFIFMLPEFEKKITQQSFQFLCYFIIFLVGAQMTYTGCEKNEELSLVVGLLFLLGPLQFGYTSVKTIEMLVGFTQNKINDLDPIVEVIGAESVREKIEEVIDHTLAKDGFNK
jgi:hypothetical protein